MPCWTAFIDLYPGLPLCALFQVEIVVNTQRWYIRLDDFKIWEYVSTLYKIEFEIIPIPTEILTALESVVQSESKSTSVFNSAKM